MIDRSKLGNYASELFDLIISRHPDWLKTATNLEDKSEDILGELRGPGFEINIPCPTKGNPPLIIEFYFPEEDLFTIGFGPTHIDCYGMKLSWHPTVLEVADKIDTVIKEIYSENLISACWKFLSSCAFINLDEYKAKLERGKITVSVSWRGTYNYNYNGEKKSLKCPNCLSLVSVDLDTCPHCKAEFYNCSNCNSLVLGNDTVCKNCNSSLDSDQVNKPTNDNIKTRSHYEYKPLEVLTNILMFLLASTIFFSLINIYGVAKDISFIKENMFSGGVLFYDETSFENIVIAISQIFYLICLYTSIIIYFIWVRCAYRNLYTLQLKPTEYSSGWAIGSYFVPILNLFRPYSIMQEIWFGSQPDYNLEDESNYDFRERRISTTFLKIWWATFLVNGIANNYSLRLSLNADTTQKLLTSYWVEIISYATGIFVSLMILYLIWEIKKWQSEKIKNKPTRYCQHCVNKVESDALLCPHCGKQLHYN